jgi:Flp pilus assembly protein TadD
MALYGDPSAAHNAFDLQLKKGPSNPLGYYGKGLLATRERNKEAAVNNLKKALSLQPHDGDFLRDLGMTYLKMGNPSQADINLSAALDVNPNDQEARFLLGRSQIEKGDLEGALKTLKGVLDSSPEYLPVYYSLGEAYEKTGQQGEAHYYLGVYYRKKGNPKNARFHLMRALELSSGSPVKQEAIREALRSMEDDKTEEGSK